MTPWADKAPLVDPILLITLVLLALPIPGKIMFDSLKEVVGMAPQEHLVDEIEYRLLASLKAVATEHVELRVSKRGRVTYVLVHVVVAENFLVANIAELDAIRNQSESELKGWNSDIFMDMLFIRDARLAG